MCLDNVINHLNMCSYYHIAQPLQHVFVQLRPENREKALYFILNIGRVIALAGLVFSCIATYLTLSPAALLATMGFGVMAAGLAAFDQDGSKKFYWEVLNIIAYTANYVFCQSALCLRTVIITRNNGGNMNPYNQYGYNSFNPYYNPYNNNPNSDPYARAPIGNNNPPNPYANPYPNNNDPYARAPVGNNNQPTPYANPYVNPYPNNNDPYARANIGRNNNNNGYDDPYSREPVGGNK